MKRILTGIAVSATLAASAFALAGSSAVVAKHGADDPAQIELQKPQVELVGRGGDDGVEPAQIEPKG